jgi:hypothetical protein
LDKELVDPLTLEKNFDIFGIELQTTINAVTLPPNYYFTEIGAIFLTQQENVIIGTAKCNTFNQPIYKHNSNR